MMRMQQLCKLKAEVRLERAVSILQVPESKVSRLWYISRTMPVSCRTSLTDLIRSDVEIDPALKMDRFHLL